MNMNVLNFVFLFACQLNSFIVGGWKYEIPTELLYNKFTAKLLRHVVEHIDRKFAEDHLIFDVSRADSRLTDVLEYGFEIIVAAHDCGSNLNFGQITFASCKKIKQQFKSCKAAVKYLPRSDVGEQFMVDQVECIRSEPSIPKNPYFLGYELPTNVDELFTAFQLKYNRFYSKQDVRRRFAIFKKNLIKIQLLQDLDRGSAQYGITQFFDFDEDEFKRTHANMKKEQRSGLQRETVKINPKPEIPWRFDWREKGAVTEVKDQGMCGSCWAFGTVGNVESQWFLKNHSLVSLSEQQLLDCDKKDEGCNGGLPEWAFPQIIQMGGLMSEENYPYKARESDSCHLARNNVTARIDDWARLPKDEKQLAAWLSQNGTITAGINANFLQFYIGGISHPMHMFCSASGLDHAVLLVGYGVSSILAKPYWIVKNSWSTSWGESGYFRLYRGDGTCGINEDVTTSIIY